jgi:hypothetical protein
VTTAEGLRERRSALLALVDRLADAHPDLPRGRITALVAVSRSELERAAVPWPGLLEATEAMARARLARFTG